MYTEPDILKTRISVLSKPGKVQTYGTNFTCILHGGGGRGKTKFCGHLNVSDLCLIGIDIVSKSIPKAPTSVTVMAN